MARGDIDAVLKDVADAGRESARQARVRELAIPLAKVVEQLTMINPAGRDSVVEGIAETLEVMARQIGHNVRHPKNVGVE